MLPLHPHPSPAAKAAPPPPPTARLAAAPTDLLYVTDDDSPIKSPNSYLVTELLMTKFGKPGKIGCSDFSIPDSLVSAVSEHQ
jgi:hypothetical protein